MTCLAAGGRAIARLAFASLLFALLPAVAAAVAPPSPAKLSMLAARCDSAGFVRIETGRSTRLVHRMRIEADGVVLPGPVRAALIERGRVPEDRDRRIPWTEVERLSVGRSHTLAGFAIGAVAGAFVGATIVRAFGSDLPPGQQGVVISGGALCAVAIAGVGALLGSASGDWTPIYP